MFSEDMLLEIFSDETSGNNQLKGNRVLNSDLVSSCSIKSHENLISIEGTVISESLFNEYNSAIELEAGKGNVLSTFCSCADFEKHEFTKKPYCCKHLWALFYKALDKLAKHPALSDDKSSEETIFKKEENLLSALLGDEKNKDEIKIEVYINKTGIMDNISAELKIGLKSLNSHNLYILKDINYFLAACCNNISINYSKNFVFNSNNHKLSVKDKGLISFIETLKEIKGSLNYNQRGEKVVDGKYLNIPRYMLREFFQVVKNHRVYLNEGFFYRPVETEIIIGRPDIDFDLKIIKDNYVLKSPSGLPSTLGSKKDVYIYGTSIYLPDYEFCYKIGPYLNNLKERKVLSIPASSEERVLRELIPELNSLGREVFLSKAIKDKVETGECNLNFYFDRKGKDISLKVNVKYGKHEFNLFEDCKEKIIYRDTKKENNVIGTLRSLGFEEIGNRFYLSAGDEYAFRFFKSEIGKLQDLGEVFYSESFKGIKNLGKGALRGEIKPGSYNYFEMDFKIGDIPQDETAAILKSFRDNLKYYKLKNGEYLDLEDLELKSFLKLIESAAGDKLDENKVLISKAKAPYFQEYFEENHIRYITGTKELKSIRTKLKNIEKQKVEFPKNLENTLRSYQKYGYKWLKTLDYLGFGGILGDEMGLGKTLQAIAFILSNRGSKTLVVAPTSLIYNWVYEFQKFAPELKVSAFSGNPEERDRKFKFINEFDVVVTTYNLLKRDMENYKQIEFDYCFIDEAQFIKNSTSQNSMAVKEIKAKARFALTGTPMENSLMELWSIFDFIMPGYLYDEKRFSVRYHKKLKEEPEIIQEVNKLIAPFILRRKKKEVIKELPDKIEKTLMVDMEYEQKKVYKAYSDYAVQLIEKRVKDDEFKNSKIEILSYLTKLRQLCIDPSVVMENYIGESAKLDAVLELLTQAIDEGHRVLVFSQFTTVLNKLSSRLKFEKIHYSYLDGTIPSEKRMQIVKEFNQGKNSVFLISLKAGGTGLNLTSADIVVHLDPWWNPAVEDQATDRAHRIGQENVVEVIKIISKGTIEEKIIKLQESKRKLISEVLGDELCNAEKFLSLTEEDVMELFKND
ncbi:MAG: DEAD/DEAH box helicase [Solirubrobacterales bacterium]